MTLQDLTAAPFSIVKHTDFYTVNGVKLQDGSYGDVQITLDLLDNGRTRTQEDWADYQRKTGWGPGSGPLETAVFTGLHDNQSVEGVDELRALFADDFRKHRMMTSTRVTYRAKELDVVTHDFGMPGQSSLEASLVGPDGYLNDADVSQALFGSRDVDKVNAVYRSVTGLDPYLWRFNRKPSDDVESALVLGGICRDINFYFNAYNFINVIRPARGVRVAPQSSTGSKG